MAGKQKEITIKLAVMLRKLYTTVYLSDKRTGSICAAS